MSETPSLPIDHFPSFLARLPPDLDIEALARETKAFRRKRGIRSGTGLLRLTLAWAAGGYSTQHVAGRAGGRGIATLTGEALIQRFHAAAAFLEALTGQLLKRASRSARETPRWHGRVLRAAGGTSLSQQASKGTGYRVHGVYDLGRGGFTHLEVTGGHGGEALDRGEPVAGEVRAAGRGYATAQSWRRFLENRQDTVDFIVRMRWNTIRLLDGEGALSGPSGWLRTRPAGAGTHGITALAQSGKRHTPHATRRSGSA